MWEEAEKFLVKDEHLGSLVKLHGLCRIKPRSKKYYFEDLVDSIIQQQLSMKAAASIFNRVKENIADADDSSQGKRHRWRVSKTISVDVTPEKILAVKDEKLRECGLSRAKVIYVKDLASKVKKGKV